MKVLEFICRFVALGAALLAITSCGGSTSPSNITNAQTIALPKLSIVPLFPDEVSNWSIQVLENTYKTIKHAGFDITEQYLLWGQVESTQGFYDWSVIDYNFNLNTENGLKTSMIVKFPDNSNLGSLPRDVTFTTFSDAALIDRFSKFIIALLEHSKGRITYLWIGNEIDVYLNQNRSQIDDFDKMYANVCKEVAAKYPNVLIGTISTYHDAFNSQSLDIIEKVGIHGNVIGFSFYPQIIQASSPEDMPKFLAEISKIATRMGKKFAITESGWSTQGLNGNEQMQTKFINSLLDGAVANKGNIEFIGLFVLHDMPSSMIDSIIKEYNLENDQDFIAMLSSLGLIYNNGSSKPAWDILLDKIQTLVKQVNH